MSWIADLLAAAGSTGGIVERDDALPGRHEPVAVAPEHLVTAHPMTPPWPTGYESIVLALGCFWGAEKHLWQLDGVWTTAVGYAGGWTPNPTYDEVCTGRTGHTESVLVVFDPSVLPLGRLLAEFFEMHDPTQGMRQGNDRGSQYRSAVYATTDTQLRAAHRTAEAYQARLTAAGSGPITTEIGLLAEVRSGEFYLAEDHHQQYLVKNPGGYDCHVRTGIPCPVGA